MATIKSNRLHIGILGQTNTGKSTLLNTITNQNVSIVSIQPGTTTDPVQKTMELKPFGPVLFIDTAGYEDYSVLGKSRQKKTDTFVNRFDVAIIVIDGDSFLDADQKMAEKLQEKSIPFCVCVSKVEKETPTKDLLRWLKEEKIPYFSNNLAFGREQFLSSLIVCLKSIVPLDWSSSPKIVSDLTKPGDIIILVIPIDSEAPKDRIILPQQQAIRDILDQGSVSIVTGVSGLATVLDQCKITPSLVITDSQAFKEVFAIVPAHIPVTGFSILLARMKGDLPVFVRGIQAIKNLCSGDRVLILEACSHNPVCNDIGREQIPNGILNFTQKKITFDVYAGHDFPENLSDYRLIIHCGGCILNRKEMQYRIQTAKHHHVPITNYGFVLSYLHGDLDRALKIVM